MLYFQFTHVHWSVPFAFSAIHFTNKIWLLLCLEVWTQVALSKLLILLFINAAFVREWKSLSMWSWLQSYCWHRFLNRRLAQADGSYCFPIPLHQPPTFFFCLANDKKRKLWQWNWMLLLVQENRDALQKLLFFSLKCSQQTSQLQSHIFHRKVEQSICTDWRWKNHCQLLLTIAYAIKITFKYRKS